MNWSGSDLLSVYGAALATVVGLIQWHQWRTAQSVCLLVSTTSFETGKGAAEDQDAEVTITNRSNLDIFVHSCWAGYSLRRWRKPWKRELASAFPALEIDGNGQLTGRGAGYFELRPGRRADICIKSREFVDLEKPSRLDGFRVRKCVAVEHSASSSPVFLFDV